MNEIDSNKLPVFKYYSSNYSDTKEKSAKAYELILPRDGDLTSPEGIKKISATFIEEMHSGINHNVKDISS